MRSGRIWHTLMVFLLLTIPLLSEEFPWPYWEELQTDINFWVNIFSKYQQNQVVLHDAENLAIIYKVITFQDGSTPASREKLVEQIKDDIRQELSSIQTNLKHSRLTPFQKYLLNRYPEIASHNRLKILKKNIRAQQGMREMFREGIERMGYYWPHVEDTFRSHGLPVELGYLAQLESSFNPLAKSHAGAAGMWQFMRASARGLMKVNRLVDQRFDPFASTTAAAKKLKYNYFRTQNWAFAITAYNFGLAGMRRLMNKYDGDYMLARQKHRKGRFGFASRNFYPEFLAIVKIMRNPMAYNFEYTQIKPLNYLRVQLNRRLKVQTIAKMTGVPIKELKRLNPFYKKRVWQGWSALPAKYWIHLPLDVSLASLQKYVNTVPTQEELANLNILSYKISASRKYAWPKPGVTEGKPLPGIEQLLTWLDDSLLTGDDELFREIEKGLRKRFAFHDGKIEVFPNETLEKLAGWLNITVDRLRSLNGLRRRSRLVPGQWLKTEHVGISEMAFVNQRMDFHLNVLKNWKEENKIFRILEYTIGRGESVWQISRKNYGIPLEIVQYFNYDYNLNKIKPGDTIKIPLKINVMEESS